MIRFFKRMRRKVEEFFAPSEIDTLNNAEVSRMARDLGMSSSDLRALDASSYKEAAELPRRLNVLGLRREALKTDSLATIRDMQRVCSFCESKGACQADLNNRPEDPRWEKYCPNAATMHELGKEK